MPIDLKFLRVSAVAASLLLTREAVHAQTPAAPAKFEEQILPVLKDFCYDCHGDGSKKGDVALDKYSSHSALTKDIKLWLAIWRNLDSQLMPPSDKPQLPPEKRQELKDWIEKTVFKLNPNEPDPGRVTVRRLNRHEYKNTIRDLTGVDFNVLDQFPADDTGYGFDTIGDVLNLSPLLFEKYLEASKSIVESILNPAAGPQSRKLFPQGPASPDPKVRETVAKTFVVDFATRAFRRPIDDASIERLMTLYRQAEKQPGMQFESAVGESLIAILSSPRFLFRSEAQPEPDNPGKVQPIDQFALASRLSYFLWSSMPDEELQRLAREGQLRANIRKQVDRMIKDWKFAQFSENFVGQWLQLRDVETVSIQAGVILKTDFEAGEKAFNHELRRSMRWETEMLFDYIIKENRPALELLTAKYTFLNQSLAKFYDIPGITGKKMQKVDLPADSIRGGILTHGSFLVVTSNPTRTSPVKRGLFVLENLLGTPAPAPPPDVPPLEATKKAAPNQSMRKLMEIHRQKPICASCHARMDPIGLALENFNAVGRFRNDDQGKPIDSAGILITGEKFNNVTELTQILATKRSHDFIRCLTEKLLVYGIGRGLEYYDTTSVNRIVNSLETSDGTLRNLLYQVVESAPFQLRRGDGDKISATKSGISGEN